MFSKDFNNVKNPLKNNHHQQLYNYLLTKYLIMLIAP